MVCICFAGGDSSDALLRDWFLQMLDSEICLIVRFLGNYGDETSYMPVILPLTDAIDMRRRRSSLPRVSGGPHLRPKFLHELEIFEIDLKGTLSDDLKTVSPPESAWTPT
jgi:hypothetical protein